MFFNLQANFGVISCQNWEKMPFQKYYDFQILLKIKSWSEKIYDSSIYGQILKKIFVYNWLKKKIDGIQVCKWGLKHF